MYDDVVQNVKLITVTFECPECHKVQHVPFVDMPQYEKIRFDDELVAEYIEAHLPYNTIEQLSTGHPVTIVLHSQLCGSKECKRDSIKKQKSIMLDDIKVPLLHKNIPPAESFETDFNGCPGVLYAGKVGAGKTYKAIALMKRYILSHGGVRKCSYRFINACDMFFTAQEEMNTRPKDGISILRKCIEADILVLDDIGTEKFSEWTNSHLYFVVNSRLECMRPTIITANILDRAAISTAFTERTASRLHLYNTLVVRGFDRRKESIK